MNPAVANMVHVISPDGRDLYLTLLRNTLVNLIYRDPVTTPSGTPAPFDLKARLDGKDVWPSAAHTMVGVRRLDNIRHCCETAIAEEIAGDFVECGVWRGGVGILMRGVLAAYGIADRRAVLFDSFRGLPPPDPVRFPKDAGDPHHTFDALAVSLETVQDNFSRYGLLDDQVVFVPGWFRDTLPTAPVERIAVLRLDGDLYESTWQALDALYPKLAAGGFVVIDDYGAIPACAAAVNDYRARFAIGEPMLEIDWTGVYWRKAAAGNRRRP